MKERIRFNMYMTTTKKATIQEGGGGYPSPWSILPPSRWKIFDRENFENWHRHFFDLVSEFIWFYTLLGQTLSKTFKLSPAALYVALKHMLYTLKAHKTVFSRDIAKTSFFEAKRYPPPAGKSYHLPEAKIIFYLGIWEYDSIWAWE